MPVAPCCTHALLSVACQPERLRYHSVGRASAVLDVHARLRIRIRSVDVDVATVLQSMSFIDCKRTRKQLQHIPLQLRSNLMPKPIFFALSS